jgi:hypothetical protein
LVGDYVFAESGRKWNFAELAADSSKSTVISNVAECAAIAFLDGAGGWPGSAAVLREALIARRRPRTRFPIISGRMMGLPKCLIGLGRALCEVTPACFFGGRCRFLVFSLGVRLLSTHLSGRVERTGGARAAAFPTLCRSCVDLYGRSRRPCFDVASRVTCGVTWRVLSATSDGARCLC